MKVAAPPEAFEAPPVKVLVADPEKVVVPPEASAPPPVNVQLTGVLADL